MTSKLTREQLHERARENVKALKLASRQTAFESAREEILADLQLAELALAAMDGESWCLPLDYLQGHKDGLEWAARLAEANHPDTGDWLYDDPIELAKAIRKGPDMPPAQPVADSEPVAWLLSGGGTKNVVCFDSGNAYADPLREVTPLYRHAQPAKTVQPVMFIDGDISSEDADKLAKVIREFNEEDERPLAKMARIIRENPHPTNECDMPKAQSAPVVLDEVTAEDCPAFVKYDVTEVDEVWARGFNSCRAAMLATAPQSPGSEPATVPGKWIPVSERMPEVGVKVLCFPAEDEPIHAVFNGQLWLQDVSWSASYEPIDNVIPITVTHWMPLPAAPQEVKP